MRWYNISVVIGLIALIILDRSTASLRVSPEPMWDDSYAVNDPQEESASQKHAAKDLTPSSHPKHICTDHTICPICRPDQPTKQDTIRKVATRRRPS